jgi:hypothetical protein
MEQSVSHAEAMFAGGKFSDPDLLDRLVISNTGYARLEAPEYDYARMLPSRVRVLGLMLPIPGAADPLPDTLEPYKTYDEVPEGYRNSGYLGRVGIEGRRLSDSTLALHGTGEGFNTTVGVYETEIELLKKGSLVDLRDSSTQNGLGAQLRSIYRQKVYTPLHGLESLAERADRQYPLARHILYNQPPDGDAKRKNRHITNPYNLRPLLLVTRTPLKKIAELEPLEITY